LSLRRALADDTTETERISVVFTTRDSRMMHRQSSTFHHLYAAMLMAVWLPGCASLHDGGVTIIRVEARRDPVKATRLTLMGVTAMEKGHMDRAAEKFLAAVDADETYGPAHNNLGLLHFEQGNLYQAVMAFEQAMDLMPHDPDVYYNLGLALESAGKVHESMELYWQAVEMDPVNPNYLGNLVRLRVRLGEDDPELIVQLQDLVLIETRPDWRRWADQQLALALNGTLDRGPETPEFNTRRDRSSDDDATEPVQNIIDLTPAMESSGTDERVESEQLPIEDQRPVETLPPPVVIPDRDEGDQRYR
jgi:tetratricopeptide (TPR) repeat protein